MSCRCWKCRPDDIEHDAVAYSDIKKEEALVEELRKALRTYNLDDSDHEARLAIIRRLYWCVFGVRLLTRVLGIENDSYTGTGT